MYQDHHREVQKICIRKKYISQSAFMYRELRNMCIRKNIYIYQKNQENYITGKVILVSQR